MFDITIAGEINLDLILYGLPREMPVERELLAADFQMTLGSSSAILAHNLAVLGAKVGFITLAGKDELGKAALARLGESGADLSRVVFATNGKSTGVTMLLHHGKERHILTYPGTMSDMSRRDLDVAYLKSSRHFHLSSLFLHRSLAADLPELFRELKSAGLTISLDTNDDPEDRWGGVLEELLDLVDVLLPNETEICRIAKRDSMEDPVAVSAVDSIGAGDSFNAGFLSGWLRGLPLEDCARAGNIAGALSTQRPGGTEAFRDREFTERFLKQHNFPVTR